MRRCDNIGSKINCLLFLRLSSAILFVWLLTHLLSVQPILRWGWSLLRTLRIMLLLIKGLCVSSGLILEGIPNKLGWRRHFSLAVRMLINRHWHLRHSDHSLFASVFFLFITRVLWATLDPLIGFGDSQFRRGLLRNGIFTISDQLTLVQA